MSESACNSPLLARALARKMADSVAGSPARSLGRNSIDGGVCGSPARSLGRHSVDSAGSSPAVSRRSIGGSAGSSPAHRSYVDSDLEDECTSFFTEERLNPDLTVIGDWVKFRDNKRWKQRWGVVTKISPAADCLHLQLYRDSKDRYRQGQTKASLSLQHFLGVESGFTLDKESNTIAIICQDVTVILAFDTRERLIQWQVKISNNLGEDQQFLIQIKNVPSKSKIATGPARLHVQDHRFSLTSGVPPRLMGFWEIALLRRYGIVEGMFCFEGGSRCGKGEGLHVCVSDQADEITQTFKMAALGKLATRRRPTAARKTSGLDSPRKQLHSRADTRNSDLSCVDTFLANNALQSRSVCGDPMNRSMCSDDGAFCACAGDLHDASSRHQSSDDLLCPCRTHRGRNSPFWPSTDSTTGHHGNSELDSNYGCGDTVSVSDLHEHYNNTDSHWPHDSTSSTATFERRAGMSALERCASCISKLGAPSMSRSSTATHAVTPGTPFSPAWTMEPVAVPAQPPALQWAADTQPCHHARSNAGSSCDRMSLSSHGSAGSSGNSEYSVPRFLDACRVDCQQPGMTPLHQHPPNIPPKSPKTPVPTAPSRPPKPTALGFDSPLKKRAKKPPMPLPAPATVAPPAGGVCTCGTPHRAEPKQLVGPYENYDVPKTLLGQPFKKDEQDGSQRLSMAGSGGADEYYDTPRNVKECLAAADRPYGNYDTPPAVKMLRKPCGCIVKLTKKGVQVTEEEEPVPGNECPCQRVMCWAENWMMLPYCRRGNGMENTGVPIHKIKLSGEGKMPVVNPSGEIAIYATVDKTKKLNRRSQSSASEAQPIAESDTNYENVGPEAEPQHADTCDGNYQNIDFAQSLEYYENSKDILQRAGISQQDIDNMASEFTDESDVSYSVNNGVKFCNKCGHSCHLAEGKPPDGTGDDADEATRLVPSVDASKNKQDDYLLMEPQKKPKPHASCADVNGSASKNHPGYIPMSPLTKASSEHQSRLSSKAASIPSLAAPFVDRSRKRGDFDRLPGSAMMTTRPYLRRVLDGQPRDADAARKRSSSADSSRYLEDLDEVERTAASSPKLNDLTADPDKSDQSLDGSRETITAEANPAPAAVHIRRSSSVPCKSGNRDSSSSNDSGVSTGSLKHRGADFAEFELPLTTSLSARRHHAASGATAGNGCLHGSLPRRSKSVDPMRELTFRFQKISVPAKSSSAEGEVPVCSAKREGGKGFAGTNGETAAVAPYLDSRSTSSGTSDMSDYIETLSLSSHESSDTQDSLRLMRPATTTLRPRSGKEYQLIDRSILETDPLNKLPGPTQNGDEKPSTAQLRSLAPALFSAVSSSAEKTENAALATPSFVRGPHVESQ